MKSAVLLALLVYGSAAALSLFVAVLIKAIYLTVQLTRKEGS